MVKKKDEPTSEEKQNNDDRELVQKFKFKKQAAATVRRKFDWEWLVRNLYVRGYHFARYNRGTNSIVFATRTGVRIPINLIGAHLRGVRNQVTSFQPKWEVLPNVTTESAFENARYSGKTLDYIYRHAQIKRKIKEVVNHALLYSIGIWQFDVDPKGNLVINNIDPFDFYVDPNVKSPNINDPEYGAEYVILSHQVTIESLQKNKNYTNTDELHTDNFTASAEYKRFLQQVVKNRYETKSEDENTVILNEAWIRERQEDGTFKMRILSFLDQLEKPLRNELTDEDEYPFEIYQGDIASGELYGESWVKHLIPINRVIDALESHIFEYNHFFARGRFVIDKQSGVRIIVNQHGQIIEKNRGAEVTSLPISPLPPSPREQIINMKSYLEDISGVHDASLGRLPTGVRSGVAIAELKQADATNQADLVDNLEDFLSRAGRRILKLVAENWTTSKLISVTGLGGKPEYFMAIGEKGRGSKEMKQKGKYSFGEMELPIAIIGAENEVRVQVGSWLAYTKEARQEKLKELFRLGAIDQKTYLEYSEFADIDGIIERTRNESLLQSRVGQPSQSVGRQFGVELDDESLAIAENEMMLEGKDQPVEPDDDHEVHLAIHSEHQKDDVVRAHINEHITQQRWKLSIASRPELPPEGVASPNGAPSPEGGIPPELAGAMGGGV